MKKPCAGAEFFFKHETDTPEDLPYS